MPHSKTVLQGGSKKLLTSTGKTGNKGNTGNTGDTGPPKNVRLLKVIVNINTLGLLDSSSYELILEQGDIWEAISSSQVVPDTTYAKVVHENFLNSSNLTKKVKVFVSLDEFTWGPSATVYTGEVGVRFTTEIVRVELNKITVGFFKPNSFLRSWWNLFPSASRPIIIKLNLYLIGEE